MTRSPRIFDVQHGEIQINESWVYVWMQRISHLVIYVGATNSTPELRSWLHLHDTDPSVGRIIARRPEAIEEDFEILAYPVPQSLSRSSVKEALIWKLSESGQLSADYIGEPAGTHDVIHELSTFVDEVVEAVTRVSLTK